MCIRDRGKTTLCEGWREIEKLSRAASEEQDEDAEPETVLPPLAEGQTLSLIHIFVMCYELIQIVIEKNNLHDLDTWIFFKWIFKTLSLIHI